MVLLVQICQSEPDLIKCDRIDRLTWGNVNMALASVHAEGKGERVKEYIRF